ncbi:unnamed protein product, partial [Gongylonema pulchrum]|uniref:Tetraspanin n=1 Tax=Gongylonema pulchrum TaxID=637853 RepID=A0A183DZI7_9BILA
MVSFWVLCGCGLAAALIGLLGTCAAVSANRAVLILFIITAILLILVEIGIGVFLFLYNSTIEQTVVKYVDMSRLSTSLNDMNVIAAR